MRGTSSGSERSTELGNYPAPVPELASDDRFADGAIWTIVVAGGSGRRFGSEKQYESLGGRRVIDIACDTARAASDGVVVVLPSQAAAAAWSAPDPARERVVAGGETRSDSVRAGLAAVPADAAVICVHDAARPLATGELFARVIDAVRAGAAGAIPGIAVTDTIKVVDPQGTVAATPDRSSLVAVQTPQAFAAGAVRAAHASGDDGTDDAALVERQGGRVVVVAGEPWNRKITEPDDLVWARSWWDRMTTGEREVIGS
jgi:2-C-methyl-D-erythritol 4-phosphate cytidylyltransferase